MGRTAEQGTVEVELGVEACLDGGGAMEAVAFPAKTVR